MHFKAWNWLVLEDFSIFTFISGNPELVRKNQVLELPLNYPLATILSRRNVWAEGVSVGDLLPEMMLNLRPDWWVRGGPEEWGGGSGLELGRSVPTGGSTGTKPLWHRKKEQKAGAMAEGPGRGRAGDLFHPASPERLGWSTEISTSMELFTAISPPGLSYLCRSSRMYKGLSPSLFNSGQLVSLHQPGNWGWKT